MERRTPKKVVVLKAAVKRSAMRAVKTSAKLEERVVPPGHQRSAAAKAKAAVAPTATGVALSLLREAFGPSR